MPRSSATLAGLRLLFGGALLASIALVASSCAVAIGAEGYQDTFEEACTLAARCYGPAYKSCGTRIEKIASTTDTTTWLELVSTSACLESCNELYACLDLSPLCYPLSSQQPEAAVQTCTISEDCCGFQDGTTVCDDGLCCRSLGAECEDSADCCPNAGTCDGGRCGGATCAPALEPCLNAFQCCSSRCNDAGFCEDLACPPEGFLCDASTDCCDLQCLPDVDGATRCKHPSCAQLGEPCKDAGDCCDAGSKCYKGSTPGATSGVCSPTECTPNSSDCSSDINGAGSDCCSGFCDPSYHLCGQCVAIGVTCSAAVPCCADGACDPGTSKCVTCVDVGAGCSSDKLCCAGSACNEKGVCVVKP